MLSAATTTPAQPAAAPPPPATCTTRSHERLKATTKSWLELPHEGYMTGFPSTDLYECRRCILCGSQLVRPFKIVKLQYVREPRLAVAQPIHRLRPEAPQAGGLR